MELNIYLGFKTEESSRNDRNKNLKGKHEQSKTRKRKEKKNDQF